MQVAEARPSADLAPANHPESSGKRYRQTEESSMTVLLLLALALAFILADYVVQLRQAKKKS